MADRDPDVVKQEIAQARDRLVGDGRHPVGSAPILARIVDDVKARRGVRAEASGWLARGLLTVVVID